MLRVELDRWGQTVEDLRRASLEAGHPRTRERFQALYLSAAGQFNATTCAAHIGRQDETVLGWVRLYNQGVSGRSPTSNAHFAPGRLEATSGVTVSGHNNDGPGPATAEW